jgi:hypothetical protein
MVRRWAVFRSVATCLRYLSGAAPALMLLPIAANAESVLALAGITDATDNPGNSYAWQLQFQEPLSAQTGASLSWINEGHIPHHHRDGAAAQFWYSTQSWNGLQFVVGAGPYFYFDTEQNGSSLGYSDMHSVAGLLSAAVDLNLSRSWFVRFDVSAVYAPGELNTLGFMVGGGYRLGRGEHQDPGGDSVLPTSYVRQQIQLFGGDMIYNELDSHVDHEIGIEYRLALLPWVAWSTTWFYAPGDSGSQRNQIATQIWLVDSLQNGKLEFSAGLGVYTPLGGVPSNSESPPANVSGMSGLRVQWNWSRRSGLILTWYRSFTNDDADRDIITLGYGFRFGG